MMWARIPWARSRTTAAVIPPVIVVIVVTTRLASVTMMVSGTRSRSAITSSNATSNKGAATSVTTAVRGFASAGMDRRAIRNATYHCLQSDITLPPGCRPPLRAEVLSGRAIRRLPTTLPTPLGWRRCGPGQCLV